MKFEMTTDEALTAHCAICDVLKKFPKSATIISLEAGPDDNARIHLNHGFYEAAKMLGVEILAEKWPARMSNLSVCLSFTVNGVTVFKLATQAEADAMLVLQGNSRAEDSAV